MRLRGSFLRALPLLALLCLAAPAMLAYAQQRGRGGGGWGQCGYDPRACDRASYDGRFTFVRVYFESGRGGLSGFGRGFGCGGGEPPWHHDKPNAERNLSAILRELSLLNTFDGWFGGNVFALDDPEIFRYPVLWMAEPGCWQPTDREVQGLRSYLLKGGFIIFDDFSGGDWNNFEEQMRRVLPELRPLPLDGSEPIFRSFFEVQPYELMISSNRPEYFGMFEDNDRTKRQLAIINFNNDIGEYMDYNATGWVPVDLSNEAYKLGVNYIIYALTH